MREEVELNIADPADQTVVGSFFPIKQAESQNRIRIPVLKNAKKQEEHEANDRKWTYSELDQAPIIPDFQRVPGLRNLPANRNPREFLRLMLPDCLFDRIVQETNKFASDYVTLRAGKGRQHGSKFF